MNVNYSSGLKLISSYSDDSEDDSSDIQTLKSNKTESLPPTGKIQLQHFKSKTIKNNNRLPLPLSIGQLYNNDTTINKDCEDDPNLHDGRIRSFPHQRGNWSTYVYIPYEPREEFFDLISCLQTCASCHKVELKPVDDPHISLTRTVVLLHHWIDGFVSSVRLKLSHLTRFRVQLGALAVYCNEERTRTFLGLQAHVGSQHMLETTYALDQCLAEYRLTPFYKDPSFHMSVLWLVGDVQETLQGLLPLLNSEMDAYLSSHPQKLYIDVTHCVCKTGNKTFVFPLASR